MQACHHVPRRARVPGTGPQEQEALLPRRLQAPHPPCCWAVCGPSGLQLLKDSSFPCAGEPSMGCSSQGTPESHRGLGPGAQTCVLGGQSAWPPHLSQVRVSKGPSGLGVRDDNLDPGQDLQRGRPSEAAQPGPCPGPERQAAPEPGTGSKANVNFTLSFGTSERLWQTQTRLLASFPCPSHRPGPGSREGQMGYASPSLPGDSPPLTGHATAGGRPAP